MKMAQQDDNESKQMTNDEEALPIYKRHKDELEAKDGSKDSEVVLDGNRITLQAHEILPFAPTDSDKDKQVH